MLEKKQEDWLEESPTAVQEPFLLSVRKLVAPPGDQLEEIESAREQLHATVDRIVDRAIDELGELGARLASARRERQSLAAELDFVIRHSNALVLASAASRGDDTEPDLPAASRSDVHSRLPPARISWSCAGVIHRA